MHIIPRWRGSISNTKIFQLGVDFELTNSIHPLSIFSYEWLSGPRQRGILISLLFEIMRRKKKVLD